MRLSKFAGAALLGLGALATANVGLRYDGELEPALAGDQHTYRWRGIDVAYTTGGDPADPDLVLLHGVNAAATSGEWRMVFDRLTDDFHVIAPDLPGFGRSDRPPLRYSAALYEDFVRDFCDWFDEPTVVTSSLSAAYVAAADGRDYSGFVAVCPTTAAGPTPPKAWLRELLRSPLIGQAMFNLIASKPSIRHFNADHGYVDSKRVTADWIDYEWRTSHVENARFAPASFVSGYLNSEVDLAAALADLDIPPTIVWGREADITPLADGRELAAAADARLVVFDRAKLLPHVEHPKRFCETVQEATIAAKTVG